MGQSGHIWSEGYANLLDTWNRTQYVPMRLTKLAVDEAARTTLVLEPRK
jgi:acyl-homoserine lactone acylase PvdQ